MELPPIDRTAVPAREVALRLWLPMAPPCTPFTSHLAYGCLVDSDKDAATGSSHAAFAPLGVNARLTAVCDPPSGHLVSPLGPVTVTVDSGTRNAMLEIRTTVSRLPSLDFRWIAFGQENMLFVRLPEAPEAMRWATREIVLW